MNRLSLLICGLLLTGALAAQEPEAAAPADAAEPAEETLVDTVPVADTEALVEEPPAEPLEEAAAEPVEEPAAEDAPARDPLKLYAGLDFATTTVSVSGNRTVGALELDSGMLRLRGGVKLAEGLGAELQLGFDQGGDGPDEATTDGYVGLYLVPTATLFETVEVAFPVGFSRTSYGTTARGSVNTDGLGYGFNLEVPLALVAEDLPDLRLSLGWMVYSQDSESRSYGANFGIRYDFDAELVRPTQALGNLFGGGGE